MEDGSESGSSVSQSGGLSFDATALAASLTVRDLEVSRSWYVDVIGFSVDRKHEREGKVMAIALAAGAVRLLITQDDGAKGLERVKGEGFSLRLTTKQNVDDLAAAILARGGAIEMGPADMPGGQRFFRVKDPDGFRFAISSE